MLCIAEAIRPLPASGARCAKYPHRFELKAITLYRTGIHVFAAFKQERRGWPGRSPAMTENGSSCWGMPENAGCFFIDALRATTTEWKNRCWGAGASAGA